MKKELPLAGLSVKHFMAIQDSKSINFTPLTTFIGNNGSGKSSVIEALETFAILATHGIDEAMHPWLGFKHIWSKAKLHKDIKGRISNPMSFKLRGLDQSETFRCCIEVVSDSKFNCVYYQAYKASYASGDFIERPNFISDGEIADPKLKSFVKDWQFLKLNPYLMTEPLPQKRSYGTIKLDKTGSNIAEYLQSIRDLDVQAFNSIIETFRVVLPYVEDLQPEITSELDRKVYLMMSEEKIAGKLPGWLLSTGTLRILALLSVLRHPKPPPVIIIEEIENGLDPRTIHLLVDEIRNFVESGYGQVIATTHSPYLLDLLKLSQIVVVERDESGSPVFTRPASQKSLKDWAQKFSPGKLYTMGMLKRS
jgi:predicted ATPase